MERHRRSLTAHRAHDIDGERGFTLVEVMVAVIIAAIAVVGLAHTFGIGRALIDRYAVARDALAAAQRRLEILSVQDPSSADLTVGVAHGPTPVLLGGVQTGQERWVVAYQDDAADGVESPPDDYKLVTVFVSWTTATGPDEVTLKRIFLNP